MDESETTDCYARNQISMLEIRLERLTSVVFLMLMGIAVYFSFVTVPWVLRTLGYDWGIVWGAFGTMALSAFLMSRLEKWLKWSHARFS